MRKSVSTRKVREKTREVRVICNVLVETSKALSDHAQIMSLLLRKHDRRLIDETIAKASELRGAIHVLQQIVGRGSTANSLHTALSSLSVGLEESEAAEYLVGFDQGYEEGFDDGFGAASDVSSQRAFDEGFAEGLEMGELIGDKH